MRIMNTVARRTTCFVALCVVGAYVSAEANPVKIRAKKEENVRRAIESVFDGPLDAGNSVSRDPAQVDWKSLAANFNMAASEVHTLTQLDHASAYAVALVPMGGKTHSGGIQIALIAGQTMRDAVSGLYEYIAGSTSRDLSPADFRVVKNGPGNYCFSRRSEGQEGPPARQVYFVRDNLALKVMSDGSRDLLPIARSIEQAILSQRKEAAAERKYDDTKASSQECMKNLSRLAAARESALLEHKRKPGAHLSSEEVAPFVRTTNASAEALSCPSSGEYTFEAGKTGEDPVCSFHGPLKGTFHK